MPTMNHVLVFLRIKVWPGPAKKWPFKPSNSLGELRWNPMIFWLNSASEMLHCYTNSFAGAPQVPNVGTLVCVKIWTPQSHGHTLGCFFFGVATNWDFFRAEANHVFLWKNNIGINPHNSSSISGSLKSPRLWMIVVNHICIHPFIQYHQFPLI